MYKILNYLFGWDYIFWRNSCDQGVARVRKAPDDKVYYYRYRITSLIDVIERSSEVIWLTCKSDKYFN